MSHLVDTAAEQRGASDSWTLSLRRYLADWTGEAGNPLEAVHQLEQLAVDVGSHHEIADKVRDSLVQWRNRVNQ